MSESMLDILPKHIPLKWLMLIVPLMTLVAWHYYQHHIFEKYTQRASTEAYNHLLKTTKWRSIQIIGVWIVAVLLVANEDIRYYRLIAEIEAVQEEVATKGTDTPSLEPLPFTDTEGASPQASQQPIQNTEEVLDNLKFRYEDTFVSYFYLQRCKHADVADLSVINEALANDVMQMGGDETLQYAIFSAAQGSYEAIYADTPCEPAYVQPVAAQFEAFMQSIR